MAGETIEFAPDPTHGSVSVASGTTDATGQLSTEWTLGSGLGTQTLNASIPGVASAEVTAIGRPLFPTADLVIPGPPLLSRLDPSTQETLTVQTSIFNDGDLASGAYRVAVLAGGVEVGTADLASLDAADTVSVEITIGPLAAGTQDLTVVADADDAITEIFEDNNEGGRSVFVVSQAALAVGANAAIAGATDEELLFVVDIPAGPDSAATFTITGGSGDADLYVSDGVRPSTRDGYDDCLSFGPDNNESCQIPFPGGGRYHVLVHSFAAVSGATLNVQLGNDLESFDIEVEFIDSGTQTQNDAFTTAAARWGELIVADIFDIDFSGNPTQVPSWCVPSQPTISDVVDDIRIFVRIVAIDGPGGTLGQAGPCSVRTVGDLPIYGQMQFDEADLTVLENNGQLFDVILHEMGHVLGLGTLWASGFKDFLELPSLDGNGNIIPGQDTHFSAPERSSPSTTMAARHTRATKSRSRTTRLRVPGIPTGASP